MAGELFEERVKALLSGLSVSHEEYVIEDFS